MQLTSFMLCVDLCVLRGVYSYYFHGFNVVIYLGKFHLKTTSFQTFSTYFHIPPISISEICTKCAKWVCDTAFCRCAFTLLQSSTRVHLQFGLRPLHSSHFGLFKCLERPSAVTVLTHEMQPFKRHPLQFYFCPIQLN